MEKEGNYTIDTMFKETHAQDSDGNDKGDYQFLNIWHEDCGGGNFFVIETKRWAVDTIDEMINVLKKYKKKYDAIQKL